MSMGGAPVAQAMEEALPYKGEGTSVNALAQGGGGGGKDREKRRGGREEGRKASSLTLSLRPSVPPDLGPLPAAGGDYTPQADQWEDHCFYTHSHHSSLRPSVSPSLPPEVPEVGGDYKPQAGQWKDHCFNCFSQMNPTCTYRGREGGREGGEGSEDRANEKTIASTAFRK